MPKENTTNNTIDAVITWVDGSDPVHRKKRAKAAESYGLKYSTSLLTGSDETRFIQNGELRYCIASIRTFMPWINTIYLVTDNQTPGFLTPKLREKYNIKIIDHSTLFESYEWALPTFNSRSIETMVWRIPGISPRFIYFNDDFIVTKTTQPEYFFEGEKIVVHGKWNKIKSYGSIRLGLNKTINYIAKNILGITRSMHLLQQIRSAQAAGFENRYFRVPHTPRPILQKSLEEFFSERNKLLKKNIQYPFRDTNQFSSVFLAHHIEIQKDNAILSEKREDRMLNGEIDLPFIARLKIKSIKKGRIRFLCLQGYENFSEKVQKQIHHELSGLLKNHDLLK